ncbi:MAG: helicase HerA domain-containing protein [Nitrososphaerales archaeon]
MNNVLDDTSFDGLKSRDEEMAERQAMAETREQLGVVISGSLSEGLGVKLDRAVSIEDLAVGRYVVARGRSRRFFCMVTDVALDATNPEITKQPPDYSDAFIAEIYRGTTTFGTVHLSPLLILDNDASEPKPVKTVPEHFTPVSTASQAEVDQVFGPEGERKVGTKEVHFFHIGAPLDMEGVKVTLNLERLVERSSGVFGKSGTGKTFLSRLLLAGGIREDVAVNLIFDMHNEYGWEGSSEDINRVKGLKQIFPGKVSIFTLDDESSRRRKSNPDYTVTIGYDQVVPEDLEMLAGILNLSEPQVGAVYALYRKFGRDWLKDFLDDDWIDAYGDFDPDTGKEVKGLKALAEDLGQGQQTLAALRRRFERMRNYTFLQPKAHDNSVGRILEYLEQGKNVVLEFGRYGSDLSAYIFVANFLTRRIHQQYVKKKEEAFGDSAKEPTPLVITIEEAHKFLDPAIAGNTIFGTIARELRKYNVTLFIVDQRPSGIDPEVMSQIGTRVTMLLDDESDIKAVLSGVSGAGGLKEVLARLDTREQALILGHAVPMPVVVQTRRYDMDFYRAMGFRDDAERAVELRALDKLTGRNPNFAGFD